MGKAYSWKRKQNSLGKRLETTSVDTECLYMSELWKCQVFGLWVFIVSACKRLGTSCSLFFLVSFWSLVVKSKVVEGQSERVVLATEACLQQGHHAWWVQTRYFFLVLALMDSVNY